MRGGLKPEDFGSVSYPEARLRFVRDFRQDDTVEAKWLAAVGRYVQQHWMIEERNIPQDRRFDEVEGDLMPLWDQCHEKTFREIRAEGEAILERYVITRIGERLGQRKRQQSGLMFSPRATIAVQFVIQILVGAVLCAIVTLVGAGLGSFFKWAEARFGGPAWVWKGGSFLEIAIWVADAVVFALYLVRETIEAAHPILKGLRRRNEY